MIIGFDGSRAFSKDRTGTENYSFQLLKALAAIDEKNTYKIFLRPSSVIPAYEPESMQENNGSRIKFGMTSYDWPDNFHFITLNFQFLWTQIGLSIQTFVDSMDVLFVPAHTLPLIRAPWIKTVVTVHDLGSEYLPQTHQIKQRLYLSLMQNYQLQTANKLIAVSNATKQDLVKKIGIGSRKIEVIYEGFNDKLYKVQSGKDVAKVLSSYHLKPQEYFLFVGTVQPRKNIARLIQAFAKLDSGFTKHDSGDLESSKTDRSQASLQTESQASLQTESQASLIINHESIKLVIVGKRGWMSDEIYSLPKELGIENKVKFLDYVKDEDLPYIYAGSITLVYPSLFEGFGLPILEAQASGTPVITSNISSMPEVAGTGAILVDPYSVDDIADAMIRVEGSKSRRVEMIKNGLENVKRFSWEKAARETLKVLEGTVIR